MSRPVYKKDIAYMALRPYVDHFTRNSYSKTIVRGQENIPEDGAVILAPNHCNALMDALVILRAFKDGTVFGARADIFRRPSVAKIMNFLKILPMVRMRDGLHNVIKNKKTTENIIEVLDNGMRFCMFCEGTHRTMRSLLPVGKGIFRIAIAAAKRFGDSKPVYVVPVGLEYGDYYRYRSTSIISYGKPINVTDFLKTSEGLNETDIYRNLREILKERISGLITYIKDDQYYESKWTLTKAASASSTTDPEELLESNQRNIGRLESLFAGSPESAAVISEKAESFEKRRTDAKISYFSFGHESPGRETAFRTLAAAAGLPYFIWCAIMCLPMWAISEYLCRYRIKDKAFHNTARFGTRLVLSPIMAAIWATVFFCTLPWQYATLLLLITPGSFSRFYEYKNFARILISDYRLLADKKLQDQYKELKEL